MSALRIARALDIAHQGAHDGAHHKQWVIDQIVRFLTGCPMEYGTVLDGRGQKYTYTALGESDEYRAWVAEHNAGADGPNTYEWDVGIAP